MVACAYGRAVLRREVLPPPPPPPLDEDGSPAQRSSERTTDGPDTSLDMLRVWIWVPEGEEIPVGAIVPHEAFLPHADVALSSVLLLGDRRRKQQLANIARIWQILCLNPATLGR